MNTVFKLRGKDRTRLETFIDAAFAFALTMLVISIDAIPQNLPQLINALKNAPAFGASFAIIMIYWRGHQVWSERFGLEDLPSILLSCFLVFVILLYVYPLKILFTGMFHVLSNGWLQSQFKLESYYEFKQLLVIYGIGFSTLNLIIAALYYQAWRKRNELSMDDIEIFLTKSEAIAWVLVAMFGVASVVLSLLLDGKLIVIAAWLYALIGIVMPIYSYINKKQLNSIQVKFVS